jgi:phosphoglycolate phosphatase (TIGR01487 family)
MNEPKTKISALAVDFDGTIRSPGGTVSEDLLAQLASLRRNGIKVILVTGRSLFDLKVLVDVGIFDSVVVENGAIVVVGDERRSLAPTEWNAQRESLLGLFGSTGHEEVIVSLRREAEPRVRELLKDTVRIELNKEAMMLVPWNVTKGSGLLAALDWLKADAQNVMAIGDAENDISMLRVAARRVAVKNAVPALKLEADYVTAEEDGKGVSEAIAKFLGPMT